MEMLKTPIRINNKEVKNRLVMAPVATRRAVDGFVDDSIAEHYDARTKGGCFGLVIMEHQAISPEGKCNDVMLCICDDKYLPGERRVVDIVHGNGSPIIAQINHGGRACSAEVTGCAPVDIDNATHEQLAGIRDAFVEAALRAMKAGFDGVEIHSAHGYFLTQVFSPLKNRRTDEYGGCLENRMRLHLEIIEAVRKAIGPDALLAIRLGACDYEEGGTTIEDSVKACKAFEAAGVDLIDISGGICGYQIGREYPGYFRELTEAIKPEVSVPVILTGGIKSAEDAEELLQAGSADMIGVARAILQDADWARRNMK